ncbi:MAG: hypothetical protein M0Z99_20185 [Betaproteobacteria bacterium]|jgi:hypothetical protein|nr:hypothetical protein [Betaproteobacteria bacterium]
MKIVFSRKGFDSSYGRIPSPVLPGIGPVSLPIPSPTGEPARSYSASGLPLADLLAQLSYGTHDADTLVHFDPDLDLTSRSRGSGWRPSLGQVGAAQSHLANRGVGVGDLFLFFGWFRLAERHEDHWRFVPGAASFHALFGWLQVGAVIELPDRDTNQAPAWLADHPHVAHAARFAGLGNTIYVAADHLRLGGSRVGDAGGCFRQWSDELKLTAEGANRSLWSVPTWLDPHQGRTPLSYHGRLDRWTRRGDRLYLRTVAKGQEFVLDCREYPEAIQWASHLIERYGNSVNQV